MVLRPRNGISLCAGAGGLDLGLMLAEPGFHTRCFVEWEDYPRRSIIAAQRAGYFAPAPIWDDVTTFDGKPFRGAIDTILAGYPCQPFSMAGQRKGADDERHLWPDVARVADELGPGLRWVFLENVAGHLSLGLETVLRDLWGLGFTPAAGLFSAGETGTSHERQRVFIVAYRDGKDWRADGGRSESGANGRDQFAGSGRELDHPQRVGSKPGRNADGCNERHVSGAASEHALDHAASARCSAERGGADQRQDRQQGRECLSGDGCSAVGHPAGIGCGEGRPEPVLRGGRDTSASAGGTVADASGAERQGQQPGQRDTGGWQEQNGYSALCRRAGLFPPGPSDMGGWADVLAHAPYLAPALSVGDVKRACDHLAAMVSRGELEEAEAESIVCLMASSLANRSRILRLLGNGVHPLSAAYAWRSLSSAHGLEPA